MPIKRQHCLIGALMKKKMVVIMRMEMILRFMEREMPRIGKHFMTQMRDLQKEEEKNTM